MRILGAGLLGMALFLAACQGVKVKPEHRLMVAVEPAVVEVGQRVTVTASAIDHADLAYVSGTVAVSGSWVLPLKYDAAGRQWYISYSIPVFVTIPAGKYEIKAWGDTREGERYEGSTDVTVK